VKKLGLASHGLPLMYNSFGVGIGLVHVFLPFMILPILGAGLLRFLHYASRKRADLLSMSGGPGAEPEVDLAGP
jgi:hypothetical protein